MRRVPFRLVAPQVAALGLALLAGAAQAQSSAPQILPGWWQYDSEVMGGTKSEQRCIHAADIDKVFAGPSNSHYHCTYPTRETRDGRARFVGVCVGKHGDRVPISLEGTYAAEDFELHGTVRPTFGILTLPIAASIHAHRLAATCPGGLVSPGA